MNASIIGATVVVVATFDPHSPPENLGAYRKIGLVLRILHFRGLTIHLLDTSHARNSWRRGSEGEKVMVDDIPINLWRPTSWPSRPLGRMMNMLWSEGIIGKLAQLRPGLVWLYNSYALEARVGLALKALVGASIVLELEDLPLARRRGLNPKPFIDELFFRLLFPKVSLVTFVNFDLMRRFPHPTARRLLLPSILDSSCYAVRNVERFSRKPFRLGYFGGLDVEKGADLLCKILPYLSSDWKLLVTGCGVLDCDFIDAQEKFPDKIEFLGRVSHEQMTRSLMSCDAVINPHSPITDMGNGVFPFKIFEALASRALLITTDLPDCGIDLKGSVLGFDGSVPGLLRVLDNSAEFYFENQANLNRTSALVLDTYSIERVTTDVNDAIDGLRG